MNPLPQPVLSYRGSSERASPVRRRVRTVLLVLMVLLGAPVVLYLGVGLVLLVHSPFTSTVAEPEAWADIASLAGGPGNVPGSLRIAKAIRDDAPDGSSYYYKLSMNPAEMDAFKQNVRREMERFTPGDLRDGDTLDVLPGFDYPRWWRPRDLPDAELLHSHYHWFVFSRQTGTVYVLTFDS